MLDKLTTHNGTWTITSHATGEHRTFKVKTVKDKEHPLHGKRIISLLSGSDNESDYIGFGFVFDKYIAVFKKHRGTQYEKLARFLEHADQAEANGKITVQHSGTCRMCNRKLTVPESIASGIGPICAGRR